MSDESDDYGQGPRSGVEMMEECEGSYGMMLTARRDMVDMAAGAGGIDGVECGARNNNGYK